MSIFGKIKKLQEQSQPDKTPEEMQADFNRDLAEYARQQEAWVQATAKAIDERLHGGQSGTERTKIIEEVLRGGRKALHPQQSQPGPVFGEWRPIKTAPRHKNVDLLLSAGGRVSTIAFWNGKYWDDGDFRTDMTDADFPYWMPLPKPPA